MIDIPRTELTKSAMGGTELSMLRLFNSISSDLLNNFQIVATRLPEKLDETKLRILWVHETVDDPQLEFLNNGGWKKFHLIVFISNWQQQWFIARYKIPWSKCMVMLHAIEPIADHIKPDGIRLIYTSTPHRGLQILIPAFIELLERHPTMQLDVFSSFKLYGWEEKDKPFEPLFKQCQDHPSIHYHGAKSNEEVRQAFTKAHIFAYPSIYQECSCISLIEAMSAACLCVHPNLGALYETAANFTNMYQFSENSEIHKKIFVNMLDLAVNIIKQKSSSVEIKLDNQKHYTNDVYDWNFRKLQWEKLLTDMLTIPREFPKEPVFSYDTTQRLAIR